MCRGGDPCHVEHSARFVMDVGQQHDGRVLIDRRRDLRRRHGADGAARHHLRDAIGNVQVGRKIAGFSQDGGPVMARGTGGRQQLEQIDRGGIRHDHFVGRSTDQRRNARAEAGGRFDPTVLVPAGDQIGAPLPRNGIGDAGGRRTGQRAERIAVEVDRSHGKREARAAGRQRISGIPRLDRVEIRPVGGHGRAHNTALTVSSSGKNTWSMTRARYGTPAVPPVPRLNPITRSTVLRWPNRQS